MIIKIYANKKDVNKVVYVLSMTNDNGKTWNDYFINDLQATALIGAGVKSKDYRK